MAGAINAILNLKDNFSNRLNGAIDRTRQMERQTRSLNNRIKSMGGTLARGTANLVKWGVAGATAGGGLFLKQSIDAFQESEAQAVKLKAIMSNTKGVTEAQINSISDYSTELQNMGVVEGDAIVAGAQQMATFQLQASSIKKIMPAMADLLAQQKGYNATGQDAVGVGNMIGKVMNGQVSALSRVGINFTKAQEQVLKFGTEQEKASTLAEVLKMNVGGVNKALAQTDQGKITQAKNAFGDMQEEVGAKVIPILGKFADIAIKNMPMVQQVILGILEGAGNLANNLQPALASTKLAIGAVATTLLFLKNGFMFLSPVIIPLIAGLMAYNTYMSISKGITTAVTTAQTLYNMALMASPVMLVVVAVGALIGIFIYLYTHCENVKNAVNRFWNGLKSLCPALQMVENFARPLIDTFKFLGDKISGALGFLSKWNNTDIKSKNASVNINETKNQPTTKGGGGGSNPPKPSKHALGTTYFQGGETYISEGGRSETAILPKGTQILTHNQQQKQMTGKTNINLTINIQGNVIGNEEYANELGNHVTNKILLAINNM